MLASLAFVVAAYLIGSVSFAVVRAGVRAARSAQLRLGQSRRDQRAAHRQQGGGGADARRRRRQGLARGVRSRKRSAPSFGVADWTVPAVALAVFVGHLFPVFHRFAGGKGVATAAGIVFALHWPLGLALARRSGWSMAFGFKISSLAALTTAALLPLGAFYVFGNSPTAWAMVADRAAAVLAAPGEHPPAHRRAASARSGAERGARDAATPRFSTAGSDARSQRGRTANA